MQWLLFFPLLLRIYILWGWEERSDVFSVGHKFANHTAADSSVCGIREEKDSLNPGEMAVDFRYVSLILEVSDVSHSTDDIVNSESMSQVSGKTFINNHLHARIVLVNPFDGGFALVWRVESFLCGVDTDGDDHTVSKFKRPIYNIGMSCSERVETTWKKRSHTLVRVES